MGEKQEEGCVLCLNRGSSSLKFAVYQAGEGDALRRLVSGKIDHIGQPGSLLSLKDVRRGGEEKVPVDAPRHGEAAEHLIAWLDERIGLACLGAVGHRVVHGGARYRQPELVTPELLQYLREISLFDPDHLPVEIALIEAFLRYPRLPQVACFDTAFHSTMPRVARILPIPRRFEQAGVERYGFHGLSYAYLMEELARMAGQDAARGRVILAHLGAGASMAAVRGGVSIDTTMGFTPTAGLPMATRSGDLDPGLVGFLARKERLEPADFHEMVNKESGLLGVSQTSGDVRELLASEAGDVRALEALAMFCYHARKWVGALAAALGGLEMLVFAGGIGENSPAIRQRICDGLEFLGLHLDEGRNADNAPLISADESNVRVWVIPTDEELMIARATQRLAAPLVRRRREAGPEG